MRDLAVAGARPVFWYLGAYLLTVVAAFALTTYVIAGVNRLGLPRPTPAWIGWAINVVPPLACGAAAYGLLARWLLGHGATAATAAAHFSRASPLYVVACLLAAVLHGGRRLNDFGLLLQLVLWLGLVAVGGITADALVCWAAK